MSGTFSAFNFQFLLSIYCFPKGKTTCKVFAFDSGDSPHSTPHLFTANMAEILNQVLSFVGEDPEINAIWVLRFTSIQFVRPLLPLLSPHHDKTVSDHCRIPRLHGRARPRVKPRLKMKNSRQYDVTNLHMRGLAITCPICRKPLSPLPLASLSLSKQPTTGLSSKDCAREHHKEDATRK
jgi:hypothetical protein